MKIAILIGLMEDVLVFAPILNLFSRLGIEHRLIDVSEERGWFLKGSQYLALDYKKPDLSIKYDPEDTQKMKSDLQEFLTNEEIDVLLIHGKSYSSILAASVATNNNIEVLNIDAGLRTYNINDDSEIIRQIADCLSTHHLTALPSATKNLLNEKYSNNIIKLVGHPLSDLIAQYLGKAKNMSTIIDELDINKEDYYAIIINHKGSVNKLLDTISLISDEKPAIILISKSVRSHLEELDKYYKLMMEFDISFVEPLDYIDHLTLLDGSYKVITDTDYFAVESSILRKVCLYLEEFFGRSELKDGGWVYEYTEKDNFMSFSGKIKSADTLLGGGIVSEKILDYIKYLRRGIAKKELELYANVEGGITKIELPKNNPCWRWLK